MDRLRGLQSVGRAPATSRHSRPWGCAILLARERVEMLSLSIVTCCFVELGMAHRATAAVGSKWRSSIGPQGAVGVRHFERIVGSAFS